MGEEERQRERKRNSERGSLRGRTREGDEIRWERKSGRWSGRERTREGDEIRGRQIRGDEREKSTSDPSVSLISISKVFIEINYGRWY